MNNIIAHFLEAVLLASIYSGVIYAACGFVFNLNVFKRFLKGNDAKAAFAFGFCALFVWYSQFDMVQMLGAPNHWGGQIISTLILAGGSRGILRLTKLLKGDNSPVNYEQSVT